MSDLSAAYARNTNFKRSRGWENLPAAQRWKRLIAISLAGAAVAPVPIIFLYGLYRPGQIGAVLFCAVVCAVIMGSLIGTILIRFGRRIYLQPFPLNWALLAGAILACTASGSLIANLIFLPLQLLWGRTFWDSFWQITLYASVIAVIFSLSAVANEVQWTTMEAAFMIVRNGQLEAQLASLESHIRPHFLFNALNTVSSLIHDDPDLAESLLGKLAALLRGSLDANQHRLSPLAGELKLVRDYLEIEHARFGDRLRYRIEVPRELESAAVPAFCLQLLVENSVKHAIAPRVEGGSIDIGAFAEDGHLCLEVRDDGPGFTVADIRPGHGLDNLQGRLAALYGPHAKLEIEPGAVRLRIPPA